ncbi:MAG: protease HtpX [Gammaproteobacteria bacterium]|nr:protease HtpX [Gammaproteobacteria bacterium]NNC97695.1 protease HtpX [Gammaproteobacteria bacterium]NNM14136.1 protease HtpX [Gammaproteobacteria bacterium]
MKRFLLFGATNMAVIFVLTIMLRILGVDQYLGTDMTNILVFSFAVGMVGAFISLFMSKSSALRSTGAKVITTPSNDVEAWLVSSVQRFANESGIKMPDVAIYESSDVNAFATGAKKNDALVAVSTGLLQNMDRQSVEGVLAHEVAHVANGDMVTMTLLQGILNTFVIFVARMIGQMVDGNRGRGIGYFVTYMIAQTVLGFFAEIIKSWFSRQREFRADAGAASMAGRGHMIGALQRLQQVHQPAALPKQMQAMGISGLVPKNWRKLFSTHPPLEERIARLQNLDNTVR